ncbi:MAG: beta-lactamase family protein [Proteobacteria bacterium]|nr:beta-lactamase family protein [Pseudomonadota bacterium]MCP4916135.1 beta-lactamase family protein [Pseudomonadota bacterium]
MLILLLACTSDPEPTDSNEPADSPVDTGPFEAVWPETAADVSQTVEKKRDRFELPAMGGARTEDGEVTALGVSGLRANGYEPPVEWTDVWHLGSCTKAMTATLVARLVVQGELSWDEPLETLLPDLDLDPEDAALTPTQLLSHQAGLPANPPSAMWTEMQAQGDVVEQRAWFAQAVLALDPAQPVGTYAYSNAGYMVMGAALEARMGASWEELVTQHVFEPLGMASCGFGNAAEDADVPDQPWPHLSDGTPVSPGRGDDNPEALGPAGTVHCSLVDWSRFTALHAARDESFLPAEQWEHLHTPAVDNYAMGWIVAERDWAGGEVLVHDGTNTMNYAVTWVAPQIDTTYMAVTNQGDAAAAVDAVISKLIE